MPHVLIAMGDIFEGTADLTVLPCSAKGTISSATARWKQAFGISTPPELGLALRLGDVSSAYPFPGPQHLSKAFCYAASVLNDHSSPEVIERIGSGIGALTIERQEFTIVHSPLLGTGAGGLSTDAAGRSLASGFAKSATAEATLTIFVYDRERFEKLQALFAERQSVGRRVLDSIGAKPGAFGFSVDLKKLFGIDERK